MTKYTTKQLVDLIRKGDRLSHKTLQAMADNLEAHQREHAHRLDEVRELQAENARLRESLAAYKGFSAEAYRMLDADMGVKCIKLLGAMAGKSGYREDVDAANAVLKGADNA